MTKVAADVSELQARVREWEGSILTGITHELTDQTVHLHFKHWDGRALSAHCRSVLLCNVSALDQDVGEFEVIGARFEILEKAALKVLERVGYLWDTKRSREERFTYPMIHLSIEGDICLAVICKSVDFT
jgi:hypothetical protein